MITIFFLSVLLASTPVAIRSQIPPPVPGTQGQWQLLQASIGVSAMHMQLLHNDKVVIFDATNFGPSNLTVPFNRCRYYTKLHRERDCTAHSVLYDIRTNTFRPLTLQTNTWCSSGSVLPDGTLLQTGGNGDGSQAIRTMRPCDDVDACDWVEFPGYLSQPRWYSTDQKLPDGRIIIVGGRGQSNYEFYPKTTISFFWLHFLNETSDSTYDENNLYPFLHLLPDGNLFIFANARSVVFDYKQNRVVKELPPIAGGDPRNYPSTGSSVLLPLDEKKVEAEVMICGGAPRNAYSLTLLPTKVFIRALSTCGRIKVTDGNPMWVMETMPIPRVMGDMVLLPNGDVIIINGAGAGTAGWENAQDAVTRPVIYHPNGPPDARFSVMPSTPRPRVYHSTAILLTDGRILVGGSNTHSRYNFNREFPTDLSLEAFFPPYLAKEYDPLRPQILLLDTQVLRYKGTFLVSFTVSRLLSLAGVSVRIVAPSFTTHSLSMNQRMVLLNTDKKVSHVAGLFNNTYRVSVDGPSRAEIAPPGYYLLFLVHAGIPSPGMWVLLQ